MTRRLALLAVLLAGVSLALPPPAPTQNADPPLAEAIREYEAGNYQRAAAVLRAALEREAPSGAGPMEYWLARCYFELRDFDRAIASARRAVARDPQNSEYHQWLGRAYGRKAEQAGMFSGFSLARKTRQEFEEAVRLNPSNITAQHDVIEFYYRAPGIVGGGDDKARRQISALAAVDPAEAHLAWGNYWLDKKKPDLAEAHYRQLLLEGAKRPDPYFDVADFYQDRHDAAHMEEAVETAARVGPLDRRLSFYRGVVRILAGNRLDEAEQMLTTYLTTVPQRSDLPSHVSAHEWLARLYQTQGNHAAAAEHYRAILQLDPRNKNAREALRRLKK